MTIPWEPCWDKIERNFVTARDEYNREVIFSVCFSLHQGGGVPLVLSLVLSKVLSQVLFRVGGVPSPVTGPVLDPV